jgi:thiol:disulfide interchange protein
LAQIYVPAGIQGFKPCTISQISVHFSFKGKRLRSSNVIKFKTIMHMHKTILLTLSFLLLNAFSQASSTKANVSSAEGQSVTQADPMAFEDAPFGLQVSTNEVKKGDVIELIFRTNIEDGLYIYGVISECVVGPQITEFRDLKLEGMELVGKLYHGIKHKMVDDAIFECRYSKFTHEAEFRQKVKITSDNPSVNGTLFYQMCSDQICKSFEFNFSKANFVLVSSTIVEPSNPKGDAPEEKVEEDPVVPVDTLIDSTELSDTAGKEKVEPKTKKGKSYGAASDEDAKTLSLWKLFLLGLGGGLLALFTPCVYPMIPMTVAFFTKETDKATGRKKALFYGMSILLIYIIAGVALAALFGETFAYTISTHWLPNTLFFLVFLVFSFAFLGMFELTLPSGLVNKMDARGSKGGYIGIFFIAFTLVVVSFSCTAPIVGTVAILSADGELIKAVVAMTGFALMFALPFTLFAFFPSWLSTMPQSGGWLNAVKVVLGFAELAFAFKFLSQADLAYHWGILDRHVFLSIWIALAFLLGLYLLGKIKFPHDSDMDRLPVSRFLMATMAFVFGIYMIPGLWGAPLKPLSGFLPPMTTQDFVLGSDIQEANDEIRFSDFLHIPLNGVEAYYDYDQALAKSIEERKPLFIDFTGHTCANCRKMESDVLSDKKILKMLQRDFIVLSLYSDEDKRYPEAEWVTTDKGKVLKSIGDINKYRQKDQFGTSGQPYYYVMDWEENTYGVWGGYKNDKDAFKEFLSEGKKEFRIWQAKQK